MAAAESGIAASVAQAGGAGIGAMIAALNMDPALLTISLPCAIIGLGLATPGKNKLHDLAIFAAVVIVSAKLGLAFGPVLAEQVPKLADPAGVIAGGVALFFHPLFNFGTKAIPQVFGRFFPGSAQ